MKLGLSLSSSDIDLCIVFDRKNDFSKDELLQVLATSLAKKSAVRNLEYVKKTRHPVLRFQVNSEGLGRFFEFDITIQDAINSSYSEVNGTAVIGKTCTIRFISKIYF